MELAQSRRVSTGLLIPEVVISPESQKRKISDDFRTIEDNRMQLLVSGVSESSLGSIKSNWQRSSNNSVYPPIGSDQATIEGEVPGNHNRNIVNCVNFVFPQFSCQMPSIEILTKLSDNLDPPENMTMRASFSAVPF
jgi:hypothetical protein